MSKPSKFIQASYDRSDSIGKEWFIDYIVKKGHSIVSEEENYNHDVITKKDGVTYYFELEMVTYNPFTTVDTHKYPKVSFLGRKKRLHGIHPYHYVKICRETKWAVTCQSEDIFKDEYLVEIEIDSKERKGLDTFYRVPKYKCKFFDLKH